MYEVKVLYANFTFHHKYVLTAFILMKASAVYSLFVVSVSAKVNKMKKTKNILALLGKNIWPHGPCDWVSKISREPQTTIWESLTSSIFKSWSHTNVCISLFLWGSLEIVTFCFILWEEIYLVFIELLSW